MDFLTAFLSLQKKMVRLELEIFRRAGYVLHSLLGRLRLLMISLDTSLPDLGFGSSCLLYWGNSRVCTAAVRKGLHS